MDVGADVDTQDTVIFDRPAYGRAVLEYVWDNYDVMRDPLIAWLVDTAADASPEDRAVQVLTELTVRHGTVEYLDLLGKITSGVRPDVLGTVMDNAVRDEHVGRLAWSMLYRWASRTEYAPVVIAVCLAASSWNPMSPPRPPRWRWYGCGASHSPTAIRTPAGVSLPSSKSWLASLK